MEGGRGKAPFGTPLGTPMTYNVAINDPIRTYTINIDRTVGAYVHGSRFARRYRAER